jgi:hypothetical protein
MDDFLSLQRVFCFGKDTLKIFCLSRKKENKVEVINRLKQYVPNTSFSSYSFPRTQILILFHFSSSKVAEQIPEMKGEHFTHFMHDINEHIKELTKSTNSQEVLLGIMTLGTVHSLIKEE